MSEVEFVDGLLVKPPRDGAPDFVMAHISIKRADLIRWLEGRDGEWVNLDIKEARSGKWYAAVNAWKPEGRTEAPRGGGASRQPPKHNEPYPNRNATTTPTSEFDDFEDPDLPF